jgi:hypothetical protein
LVFKLPNYEFTQFEENPGSGKEAGYSDIREKRKHEGQSISKEDLRQVQDRAPQGRGAGDLREFETQTKAGVIWHVFQALIFRVTSM